MSKAADAVTLRGQPVQAATLGGASDTKLWGFERCVEHGSLPVTAAWRVR